MKNQMGVVALECILDLGITVVYAVIVGFLIVGIVASDEGPVSILQTSLYALVLPGAALLLVGGEIGLRLFKEWRASRTHRPSMERRRAVDAFAIR